VSAFWNRRWSDRRKFLTVLAVLAVLCGVSYGTWSLVDHLQADAESCENQGMTDVTRTNDGECIGVTDGTYLFNPGDAALVNVEDKIKAEDAWVRGTGKSYVTVAYLMPAAGGTETEQTFDQQLEGAYTVQYYADSGGDVQGTAPLVQLLIASSGVDADEYPIADADLERDVASQHLVAVAGIVISEDSTLNEVKGLTAAGIPIFGSNLTADDFDNIPDFVRVAPSNSQEVEALLKYIKPRYTKAFLIEDTNPDDIYDTSLWTEFRSQFPDRTHTIVGIETYDSEGEISVTDPIGQEVSNVISQMPSGICTSGADVVLFGGRGRDMATLIGALASRPCLTHPVTIVTGDDASSIQTDGPMSQGLASGVTVYYATESDPGEWAEASGTLTMDGTNEYAQSRLAYLKYLAQVADHFGAATAVGADTTMGYDAMLTSISAIHLAGEHTPANVTTNGVAQELSLLQGSRSVYGASGPISLSGVYTGAGAQGSNPVGKVVPILRLSPSGEVTFVELQQVPVP
jgi:ABC-type branched-subunit amino acid transport system substrate-binding protein